MAASAIGSGSFTAAHPELIFGEGTNTVFSSELLNSDFRSEVTCTSLVNSGADMVESVEQSCMNAPCRLFLAVSILSLPGSVIGF